MRSIHTSLIVFVAATIVIAFEVSGQKSEPADLKVMSFNIRYGTARDGENRWDRRHELVLKTIRQFGPDLLGTQETLKFQAEYLQKHLTEFDSFGRSREKDPDKGEQCTIFYRKDRFEKVKSGQFWLSESPDQIGSKSWDSSLPRIATWVLLKDKQAEGRQLLFLNTHFDHRGQKARLESARLIHAWLSKHYPDQPLLVTGDFNCAIGSEPFKQLVHESSKLKLRDTYRVKFPQPGRREGTFNGFKGTATGARIDWVLATEDFQIQSAAIDRFNQNGQYPSDHFPVTARLRWGSQK